ncbi:MULTISPECIES: glycoside hydrolase family 32 protein [Enterococcus]|uniref:Sucrose-6-phosphate hydrolase n=1 Tax=Candidatus Enterococcus murrayae TaxID=2815321 RepID=A0ABS3HGQ1_9ENTE|nr:glycoside hydrolase family 32 protein [Enterococcus sp. MJM16]MBO0452453.1 glycoside hydrolase family 32 protein [Enterococcus sp. MJM16]
MANQHKNSFHIEPAKGLLNDPNGLIQFKGTYYFFHQWNRFETNHEYKEWGLFTSKDLVQWESQGSAILPDTESDKNGIYSGSAIEKDGKMYLFYTGNSKNQGKRASCQKIAYSEDGKTFIKMEKVIKTPAGYTEHHRDPKVWQKNGKWWMIVGAQSAANVGAVTLFESSDLINWHYQGEFYSNELLDQMCECPDVFSLSEEADILLVCPQKRTPIEESDLSLSSYAGYLVGKVDYQQKKFIEKEALRKIDYGFDFYAPQTFEDDKKRRIITAWMSRMGDKEEVYCPTVADGYLHCLTMPRELKWKNDRLYQLPLEEYQALRKDQCNYREDSLLIKNQNDTYEMIIEFQAAITDFSMTLNSERNSISYREGRLEISRINWVSGEREAKVLPVDSLSKLHIFNDNSAMEVFINDGEYVFSMRTFSTSGRDVYYQNLGHNGSVMFYNY